MTEVVKKSKTGRSGAAPAGTRPAGGAEENPRSHLPVILLAAIVIVGIALVVRFTQVPSEPPWYESASRAFLNGDIDSAQQILSEGLGHDPGSVDGRELLAECQLAQGQYADAMVTFRQVEAADRTRPHIVTRLAEASIGFSPSESLEAAREAVIQEPRSPRARVLLAWNMARAGAVSDALIEARAVDTLMGSNLIRNALEKTPAARTDAAPLTRLLRAIVYKAPY